MLELRPVEFNEISRFFVDFQKKSHVFELPPEEARFAGIYDGPTLVGYFVLVEYGTEVEINQGYLRPGARHRRYSYEAMRILEEKLKNKGYKQIVLNASRSLGAYQKFMKELGYKPESITFCKEI